MQDRNWQTKIPVSSLLQGTIMRCVSHTQRVPEEFSPSCPQGTPPICCLPFHVLPAQGFWDHLPNESLVPKSFFSDPQLLSKVLGKPILRWTEMRMSSDFLTATMKVKIQWSNACKILSEKYFQPRIPCLSKLKIKCESMMKTFSDMQNVIVWYNKKYISACPCFLTHSS